ncbi:MAG: hypothetical protein JWL85_419 [Candidatus Saccharibacteria bacterium]|nr:hypothetical protein [Candidatus Saccharibacteria bacterium]
MPAHKDLSEMRVAIVHDWLYGGGAELVVEQLHKAFPDAPIYASFCTPEWRKRLDNKVVTGFLQHQPFRKFYKYLGFLRIWWYTHLNLKGYDLVISSSGAEAKGIKVPEGTVHINYCQAPTHYYWSRYDEYMKHPGFGVLDPLARVGLRLLIAPLRRWDLKAAGRPHYMIANSTHIQSEIKKYYGRDAVVVHPPVYFERFQKPENNNLPRHGFIISGRQTPYKRFDLAIAACTQLSLPLTVIGDGPDNARLRSLAGPSVTFLGRIPDGELERQFASAEALIFPGLDDFGITPIEAMASGTPVIAYKAGGALDYVIEGKTGAFSDEQSVNSLATALKGFKADDYSPQGIKAFAEQFSEERFQQNLHKILKSVLQ